MTSQVYLQPHLALADNIVSHRVTRQHFLQILRQWASDKMVIDVVTRYYQYDMILEVCQGHKRCYTTNIHGTPTIYGDLELVYSTIYEVPVTAFPLDKNFHHERQAIVLTIPLDSNATLIMEILITGIKHRPVYDLDAVIEICNGDSDTDCVDILSLSFRVVVQKPSDISRYIRDLSSSSSLSST